MAKIWIWSDQHFGHAGMYAFLRKDGVTRVRPEFLSHVEGDAFMINAYNETVKPPDHCYFLGDFAMGKRVVKAVGPLLHGHKRIVLGNHDEPDAKLYHEVGFKRVCGMRCVADLWFTHAPMYRDAEHSQERKGKILGNVHGHIHEQDAPTPWHYNVAVERLGYKPMELDEIVEVMKKRKEEGY